MNINQLLFGMMMSVCIFSACSKKEVKTYTIHQATISAEAPLLEGPNTIQGDFDNDLANFAKDNGFVVDDLGAVTIKSIVIKTEDSLNFDNISSLTLQMVSSQSEMMELGVINPIAKGTKEIKLNVAGDPGNILELMKEKKLTLVADANLIKDSNQGIVWNCSLEFDLSYKK